MIIVIGSEEDFHAKFIYENLKNNKNDVCYFDSRKYPILNWTLEEENSYIIIDNKKLYTKDIKSIYWRWYHGVIYDKTEMIYRERTSALESLLSSLEDISYNSLQAVEMHRKKALQSRLMLNAGIRIPKTLITNDKNAIFDFYSKNNNKVIYKPVRGGAYTQKLKMEDFSRLDTLANCPAQFQEFVDGVDIRVYAFNTGEIFAGEIHANNIDFREDQNAKIIPVKLPKKIQKDCLKVMKLLGLKYSGIDIRLSKDGEYVFIEANPAPMFYHFENITKYPITETLINNLTK